jgi:hypothetical protein
MIKTTFLVASMTVLLILAGKALGGVNDFVKVALMARYGDTIKHTSGCEPLTVGTPVDAKRARSPVAR